MRCRGKGSVGWGAMVSVASVLMAHHKFTGVEALSSAAPDPEWVASVGKRYQVLNLYFKPYASSRSAQPAIGGALNVVHQNGAAPNDILGTDVRPFEPALRLGRAHPPNTEEAQCNLAYPVAATLIGCDLGPP